MSCVDKLFLFVLIAICKAQEYDDYLVPVPKVKALFPQGIRVTLRDDAYTSFGFGGTINKEIRGISGEVDGPKGAYWVYTNYEIQLNLGDTIYYWIFVKKNGKVYQNTDLKYTVTEFVDEDNSPVRVQTDQDILNMRHCNLARFCTISKTVVEGHLKVCKDHLIFNEDFDVTSLKELTKWEAMIQFPIEPDYPFNLYIPDSTVRIARGTFVITPVLTESQVGEGFLHQALDLDDRCTGNADSPECKQIAFGAQILPPVTTAKITTKRSFNFMYGRVEVRAKLPSGSWIMPEINLEPSDNAYGLGNYASGLMRIAFVRGNPGLAKKLYGGPVLTNSEPFRSLLLQEKIGIDNWHEDYHNYTMIWRPDGIDLLVDGEQYGTVNPAESFSEVAKKNNVGHATHWQRGTVMAPLDQMFHLTLGLRVGGVNDFADDLEGKPWKNSASKAMLNFWKNKDSWHPSWYNGALRVDYVRVYAL